METLEIIVVVWLLAYLLFALAAWRLNAAKQKNVLGGFPLDDLTVIVPFRNECNNLENMADYLGMQKTKPRHVIFVDDHSYDAGQAMLHHYMKGKNVSYEIIRLDEFTHGKKEAIMAAVKKSTTTYCHTLDADIHIDMDWFQQLPKPEEYDMLILPVRMNGFNLLTFIFEIEYGSFQILQAMVSENKPLMASGANLIFKKDAYLKFNMLEEHAHRCSGDDQYALAQFLKHNLKVKAFFDLRLAISTDTPDNLGQLLKQRVRWMGNNTQGNDWRASLFALLVFLLNAAFFSLSFWFAISFEFPSLLGIVAAKIAFDFILYFAWFKRNNTWDLLKFLPLLSVFYPLYLIVLPLTFLLLGRKITWKNRKIKR